jgi:hypothetical protein
LSKPIESAHYPLPPPPTGSRREVFDGENWYGGAKPKRAAKPKSATKIAAYAKAGYTKTARKDAKGRVVYTSKSGEDKVRCKVTSGANAGKLTWRKAAAA